MQEINYRQDFTLLQSFYYKNEKGDLVDFGFPPYDFKIFYWTASRANAYVASCRYANGEPKCVNCRKVGDNKLLVVFDNHKLSPGELHAEMIMEVPDDMYPDGFRRDPFPMRTDVRLIHGPTPTPTRVETTAILPYIKGRDGKDGKDFSYDDMTEEQKEDLAKRVAGNVEMPDLGGDIGDFSDDDWSDIMGEDPEEAIKQNQP